MSNRVTFIINGESFSLAPDDVSAIQALRKEDKQVLISLLESIRQQEKRAEERINQATAQIGLGTQDAPINQDSSKPERLGSGDVDAIMQRLILEERQQKKPGLTQASVLKVTGGICLLILLLVILF